MKRLLALALLVCAGPVFAQNAAPLPTPKPQFFDNAGYPLAGGQIYFCVAGSSCPGSPLATYTDSTAGTPNPNPVVLDAAGRAAIWIGASSYKIVAEDAAGNILWTQDNVSSSAIATSGQITGPNGAALINYTAAGSGAVSRTVASRLGDSVSVKDFGAKGDGSTVDSAAFAAAATYVTSIGRGTILVPAGTYLLSGDWTLGSNTTVECSGAALKMQAASGNHNIITISGVSNVTVEGCELDGTGMTASSSDSHTLRIVNSTNINITGNYIHNSPEDGIRVGSSTGGGTGTSLRIVNNYIATPGTIGPSGSCVGVDSITGSLIAGNTCQNPLLDGIDLEPNSSSSVASSNMISGNVLIGTSATTGNGISLFQATGATAPKDNVISGNTAIGFGQAAGVVLYGSTHTSITGNTLAANLLGVQIKGGSNYNSITGNKIDSNPTGISYENSSTGNNSAGNNITNASNGIQEVTSAAGNTSADFFALNTNNFGTLSTSFSYMLQGSGGNQFWSLGNINGTAFKEGSGVMRVLPSSSAGSFNPIVQAGDQSVIFTNAFALAPSSASSSGIRMDGTGKETFYSGVQLGTTGTTLSRYAKYTAALSPSSVGANTCTTQTFSSVTGIQAGDLGVNVYPKPTYQTGLSIAGWSASGSNSVTINFCNNTASPITPTASETYTFVVTQ